MKNLILGGIAFGLVMISVPAMAQQSGAARLDGPYTSAAQAASHDGGVRAHWRHMRHHRHNPRHYHRMR